MLLLRGEEMRERVREREGEGWRGGKGWGRGIRASRLHIFIIAYRPITLVNFDVDSAVFQRLFYICTVGFSE